MNWFFWRRKRVKDKYFESERLPPSGPFNCPHCAGRIEKDAQDNWYCRGLANREEVEQYLAPEFPKQEIQKQVQSKPACGWSGRNADWGKLWI